MVKGIGMAGPIGLAASPGIERAELRSSGLGAAMEGPAGRQQQPELGLRRMVLESGLRQRRKDAAGHWERLVNLEAATVRLSKLLNSSKSSTVSNIMEAYGFKNELQSMEAYSDHSLNLKTPELHQLLVNSTIVHHRDVIIGLSLGSKKHSTVMLTPSPKLIILCLIEQGDTNRENRHRITIESCRIGEASNPGPGLQNKQHKQLKLGDFFSRNHIQMHSTSEWCKALGYMIHNIRGDGHCLYTSLGKG
eukprot:8723896-Heterocapsa_arctica.AAC.1